MANQDLYSKALAYAKSKAVQTLDIDSKEVSIQAITNDDVELFKADVLYRGNKVGMVWVSDRDGVPVCKFELK